ncbi:ATP-dependent DNA helicase RecG [Cellvibrio polysaccharolyticus]|uniref:ATP-dependent DNA helicase RecG n=1 Tax=Cellvibrio polysaccharolyticus TaxID=2082724 RepID=A0A928YVF6_9GAMM|nr:ATP-dependent DNA helicase RecG [Cellvibrio polysaccharolyticus]MBE8718979.1 ATP-dependent DNA helicase RecG [Cellvibrio polysaccharolyticus]
MSTGFHAIRTLDKVPVSELKGVGAVLAGKLQRIGIYSIQDLLLHLPTRYMDRTRITPIGGLQPNAHYVIEGSVRASDIVIGKRRSLVVRLQDDTGTTTLRFYHFNKAQKERFAPGARLRVFGETRRGSAGLEFYHPEYESADTRNTAELEASLTPVYPATDGLSQSRLRQLSSQALQWLNHHTLQELIPEPLRDRLQQSAMADAIRFLHHPPASANLQQLADGEHPFQQRLAFEELLAHHLSLLLLRREAQAIAAPRFNESAALVNQFLQQLGFSLTAAQQRVCQEISQDLASPLPMLRLVQGDVGSGKTVVAAMAALAAAASGQQTAIMAPTEILAEQHRNNFSRWLEPLGISVAWLTGKLKVAERRQQLAAITSGEAAVVVGTHALFQADVEFARLGLVIIDEQHRFGVNQRLSLRQKGANGDYNPHQLIMTATPIPRTLAMSAYADLDCSIIDELPPGRTPVTTVVISQLRRADVIERVRLACNQGRQAYWVCTLIEESETLEAQAAEATAEMLAGLLAPLRVGLLHGRLKADEKEQIMAAFKAGELDLLVATTVIEVGVDVPNASLMIIENPERLGLAQLHQLRGRVGRGTAASHCVLLYSDPLSAQGKARLNVMRESNDGFVIAEQDLQLRGAGEVLGTRQTGEMQFRIANLQRDAHLLTGVKQCALVLMSEYPEICAAIVARWIGQNQHYLQV